LILRNSVLTFLGLAKQREIYNIGQARREEKKGPLMILIKSFDLQSPWCFFP